MRVAPEPVKLRIANVFDNICRSRIKCARWRTTILILKTPRNPIYSRKLRRFEGSGMRHPATLTKTGRSRISRANCPRWPGPTGGGSFGPEMACFGPASITGLISLSGKLPGQRRTTREADLSTQQTGAQAPPRLPRPPCDGWRPQGPRCAPGPGPQASERL